MNLVQKTGHSRNVYLDQGWIMNWDQLKVVGIVPEGYPIICVSFCKFKDTSCTHASCKLHRRIEELSKYVKTFNCYELTLRNRTRSITYSALSTNSLLVGIN